MPVPIPRSHMEEIRAPLDVVRRLLGDNRTASAASIPGHFCAALDGKWDQVPLLNDVDAVEQLRPGSLVRFRCMIQNIYNPEWYLGEYDHVNASTGERVRAHAQYCDSLDVPHGFTSDTSDAVCKTMERLPLHCMSIPHESPWISGTSTSVGMDSAPAQRAKRTRGGDAMEEEGAPHSDSPCSVPNADIGMDCDNTTDEAKRLRSSCASASAAIALAAADSSAGGRPALVPGASHVKHAAIVKIYQEDPNIKVNEVYEFVGVLCCDPAAESEIKAEAPGMLCAVAEGFMESGGPASSSLIPRIHVVWKRQLSPTWSAALETLAPATQALRRQEVMRELPALRARVLRSLASAMLGDTLAAEYLLCHLLSRVFHRATGVPVGKLSLAIIGMPPTAAGAISPARHLASALQDLLPALAYVPMSISHLNSKLMMPRKDYDTELLHTGDLQIAPCTQVLLDETVMEAGQLKETGLKNLHGIQQLVSFQHILFDFSFYQMECPTDVPVLVVSQGKPLVNTDVVLKLRASASDAAAVLAQQQAASCADTDSARTQELCRIYMALARTVDVSIGDDLSKLAQDSWVHARQADSGVGQETLGRWLTIAKLLAASYGSTDVTKEHWQQLMAMEAQRAARAAAV